MVTPVQRQQPTCGVDRGEGGQVDDIAEGGKLDESLSGRDLLMDPSTCTFWCAVALGALARGSPLQSVSGRVRKGHGWVVPVIGEPLRRLRCDARMAPPDVATASRGCTLRVRLLFLHAY